MRQASSQIAFLAGMFFFSGCAHFRGSQQSQPEPEPKTLTEVIKRDLKPSGAAFSGVSNPTEIMIHGIKLQNTQFDFPVQVNSRVEQWVEYFLGKGRPYFAKYLERSEFFIPYITPLLRQNKMPEDLVYLAMIESGFNNHARSRAKAVGPWQFISATGKRYGLMVNWWVDERRDTRKSTLAAVEYLKDLHEMFQSWELAAAAYNSGEAKIARAIRRFGVKDFWVISRHRFLRPETRDYVPKIIAAALIAKNRTQFGFPASSTVQPSADEAVAGDGSVVKVESETDNAKQQPSASVSAETLATLLKDEEIYDPYEDDPEDEVKPEPEQVTAAPSTGTEPLPLAKSIPTPQVSKKGELSGSELAEFEVQSPADLLKVARAAELSYQTVKSLNPEILSWCTPPMAPSFRIKLPSSAKDKFLANYNHAAFPRKVSFLSYKVHKGETLSKVANRFGIKVDPVADLNGISPRMPLRSGTKILLPMPNDQSRSVASLEIRDPPEKKRFRRRRGKHNYKVTLKNREGARVRPVTTRVPPV